MIIPISTDYRMSRVPWVNYAIIAANVILFVLGYNGSSPKAMYGVDAWLLHPDSPQFFQFFSCVFLHGGWAHLIGNMIFLWVFGNAVNDRFGQAGYLAFYLAGGVIAGVGYVLLSGHAPVLGASGAISAVTGAYLVLLPRARVTLLALLVFVFLPFEISSLFFLLFQFIWNLVMSLTPDITGSEGGGVAYAAHSSGYVMGILVSAILLTTRVLPRNPYDLLSLVRNYQRRRTFRSTVRAGYDPFSITGQTGQPGDRKWVEAKAVEEPALGSAAARELELRRQIGAAYSRQDLPAAADAYLELVAASPEAVLSRQQQLDIANYLMSAERYEAAAGAYERFRTHYPNYEHLADIHLMLGLLYGRYLEQYGQARHYLELALTQLHDARKIDLARGDLESIRSRGH